MGKNKYLDFVSDKHFLNCVKYVCDSYPEDDKNVELTKHSLDALKMVFDMMNHNLDFDEWIGSEKVRQIDKTVNNRIGEFHQKLLGGVNGWEDLGRGHPLGIDLKKQDNSIFIELKNRYNTVKGEDLKHVFDKLKRVADENPESKVYYAYVVPKKPSSGEKIWKTSQREEDKRIFEVWGLKVYDIVTGDKNALLKVFEAIPLAIKDIYKNKSLPKKETEIISNIFKKTFID